MDDAIVISCQCNPKNNIHVSRQQFKYINRIISILGFDNVDWNTGIKIYMSHEIARKISKNLENNSIVEPRKSNQPMPHLRVSNPTSGLHFIEISLPSKQLLGRLVNLLNRSLGVVIRD